MNSEEIERLKALIESKRKIMHSLIDAKDYDKLIKVSQELDELINEYNKMQLIKESR